MKAARRSAVAAFALCAGLGLGVLAGCGAAESGAEQAPSATESPASTESETRTFTAALPTGAKARVSLPVNPPPDREVDRLRRDAGVPRASYASVQIDNTRGSRSVSVSRIVITGRDGGRYRLDAVAFVAPQWTPSTNERGKTVDVSGAAMSDQRAGAVSAQIENVMAHYSGEVPVGASGEEVLVGDFDAPPQEIASIELVPTVGRAELAPVTPNPVGGDRDGQPSAPEADDPAPTRDDPSEPGGTPSDGPDPGDPTDGESSPDPTKPPTEPESPSDTASPVAGAPTPAPVTGREAVPISAPSPEMGAG